MVGFSLSPVSARKDATLLIQAFYFSLSILFISLYRLALN